MGTVTGFTAAKTQEIYNESITGGTVNGLGELILTKRGGGTVNAGSVKGPQGNPGTAGSVSGTLGSSDNRLLRSDGTVGNTAQGSLVTLDDTGKITLPVVGTMNGAPSASNDLVNKLYVDQRAGTPLWFYDNVENGTATTPVNYGTHDNLTTAVGNVRMIVTVSGWIGAPSVANQTFIFIRDSTNTGFPGPNANSAVNPINCAPGLNTPISIECYKDYTSGQSMGFRIGYNVNTSNIYIRSTMKVEFQAL